VLVVAEEEEAVVEGDVSGLVAGGVAATGSAVVLRVRGRENVILSFVVPTCSLLPRSCLATCPALCLSTCLSDYLYLTLPHYLLLLCRLPMSLSLSLYLSSLLFSWLLFLRDSEVRVYERRARACARAASDRKLNRCHRSRCACSRGSDRGGSA
jgi:hypothetical protein